MNTSDLDDILALQLAVAWAGEGETRPPRPRWWRTALNAPALAGTCSAASFR